jgi:hypothetical protein
LDKQRQLPRFGGRGPFSLGRGLDVVPGFLQAEHHLVVWSRLAFKRRRRPSRIALASSCYAASRLAGATPSEGLTIVGPQQAERLLSARRAGREKGHGRVEFLDVGVSDLHWNGRTIEHTRVRRKSDLQNPRTSSARARRLGPE